MRLSSAELSTLFSSGPPPLSRFTIPVGFISACFPLTAARGEVEKRREGRRRRLGDFPGEKSQRAAASEGQIERVTKVKCSEK